jgi:hypothetical protein
VDSFREAQPLRCVKTTTSNTMKTTFRSLSASVRRARRPLSLALALVAGASLAQAQDAKAVLDLLVKEGILTSAQADKVSKDASKTPAPVLVTAGGKSTTKLSLGGRFQFQYDALGTSIDNAADPAAVSHFFARRAYLAMKGSVGPKASFDLTYDLATSSFDAAFVKFKQSDDLAFDFGLRKVNMAYEESTISSGALKSIERTGATRFFVESENGRRLGAGGYRLGVFAEGKSGPIFWGAAVTNPERMNSITAVSTTANNNLAYWGNVGVKDKLKDVKDGSYVLGAGLGYLPDQGGKTVGTGNDLIVGNLYADLTLGNFSVVGEYLLSRNENGAGANKDADSYGFWIQPSYKFDKHWEGVIRYCFTDSDGRGINLSDAVRNAPSGGTMDKVSDYFVGFIYYLSGNDLKIQAGYVYAEAKDTVTGAPAKATSSGIRSQMQIQF